MWNKRKLKSQEKIQSGFYKSLYKTESGLDFSRARAWMLAFFAFLILNSSFLILNCNAFSITLSTGNTASGDLVGHWELSEESENVGSDLETNGNMESGFTSGIANNWTLNDQGSGTGTLSEETTDVHSGSSAQKIVKTGGSYYGIANTAFSVTAGKTYKLIFWHKNTAAHTVGVYVERDGLGAFEIPIATEYTKLEYTWTANATTTNYIYLRASDNSTLYIDDVTVKELHTADSTLNNNDGTIYGATYTAGRDGKGAGEEMISNGDFDDGTGWTFTGDWTISGGTLNVNGIGETRYTSGVSSGNKYIVTFTVSSYTSGSIKAYTGSSGPGTARSAVGTYTETLDYGGSGSLFYLWSGTGFVGSVDNVSVREVLSGQALHFDGTNDYIEITDPADGSLDMGTDDFTISGWFRTADLGTTRRIVYKDDGSIGYRVYIDDNGKVSVYPRDGTDNLDLRSTTQNYDDNAWHHFVYVHDAGSTVSIYMDGAADGSGSLASIDSVSNASDFYIGRNDGGGYFNGSLDDIRIYKRALSFKEIKALYEGHSQKTSTGNTKKGLVGHWPLNKKSVQPGDQLITNWDMELDSNWATYGNSTTNEQSSTQTHGDSYSRKFVTLDASDGIKSDTYSVTAGKTYKLNFWVYPDDATSIRIAIRKGDDSGLDVDTTSTYSSLTQDAWNLVAFEYTATTTGSSAYVIFHSGTETGGKTWYIDDVSLKEVNARSADTTGHANHGTIYSADVRNHGYEFDGTDDYIDLGNDASIEPSYLTLSAWINPDETNVSDYVLSSKENGGYSLGINVTGSGANKITARTRVGGTYYNLDGTSDIPINTWTHVSYTYDGSTFRLYVNGVEENSSSVSGTIDASAGNLFIGAESQGATPADGTYFNGNISDARVYDRALTATEVLNLYNGADIASPVGHWPLASGAGDISGNGNHGTVTGAILVGESASFDGVDDYITVADDDALSFGDGVSDKPFSVSSWVNMTDRESFTIVQKNNEYSLGNTNHWRLYLYDANTSNTIYKSAGDLLSFQGQWMHLITTYDGSGSTDGINFYKDGSLYNNGSAGSAGTYVAMENTSGALSIGDGSNDTDGYINDVRIFDHELSQTEITSLYAEGRTKSKQTSVGNLNKGLVGHWPLTSEGEKVGSDLHTATNAISVTNEVDTTTDWTSINLGGAGNIFASQNSVVNNSSYAIQADSNSTPTGAAAFYKRIGVDYSLVVGKKYRISFDYRHVGSGSNWRFGSGTTWAASENLALITITNAITTWKSYSHDFIYSTDYDYVSFIEYSGNNDGGVYLDNFSLKELNTADTTPSINHGTIYGADVRNHGYEFDGTNDYILSLDSSSLQVGADSFTVSLWAKPGTQVSSADMIGTESTISTSTGWVFRSINTNGLLWKIYVYDGTQYVGPAVTLPDNNWHLITAVFNRADDTITSYIDGGTPVQTSIAGVGSIEKSYGLGIGWTDKTDRLFTGNISDARIYDRALSATEVLNLYQGADIASPIGHWPLSTGAGDISGNGNAGTVTGATLIGNVAKFDGVDDYLGELSDIYSTNTISMWIYSNNAQTQASPPSLISWDQSGGNHTYDFRIYLDASNNLIAHWDTDTEDGTTVTGDTAITNGTWEYITVTQSSSTFNMYLNGTLIGTSSISAHLTGSKPGVIGRTYSDNYPSTQHFFDGSISDTRIYDRAISLREVQMLYERGRP